MNAAAGGDMKGFESGSCSGDIKEVESSSWWRHERVGERQLQ
jgi:hypothetical protein